MSEHLVDPSTTGVEGFFRGRSAGASVVSTVAIVVAGMVLWTLGSTAGWWNPGLVPEPLAVARAFTELLGSVQLWDALRQTLFEIVVSFALGSLAGIVLGVVFWRAPVVGRILEPYVISIYAVPMVVFYPVMLVVLGITPWSLIVLTVVVVTIPILLNTWIGLEAVPDVYFRLGASLECTRRQTFFRLALPAALPQVFAGLRIGAIFSIISVIAMEFLLAPGGLGFHVRYEYHAFHQDTMFAYIAVIFVIAIAFSGLVRLVEAQVLAHRDER